MASVKKVVLVLGPPEFQGGIDSRQCLQKPKSVKQKNCSSAPFKNFKKMRAINRRVLDAFRENTPPGIQLEIENPFRHLCNKKTCRQIVNGNSVYWDKDHLSNYASRYLVFKWDWLEDKYSKTKDLKPDDANP